MKTIQQFMQRPWIYLFIVIIGISLKFYKLDNQYFWYDETWTILHTSGLTNNDYIKMFPENEVKNIGFYQDLLHLNKQDYTIGSQLKGIWRQTNMTPLHYIVLVFWHHLAGDSDIHYRLFNVFMLILTLPFLYLLAKLLFKSKLAGWIAISIFCVSPFFQKCTVEARYNILCTFLLIVNQYLFLRSIKENKLKWWAGYAIMGILLLYGSFHMGMLFIANFTYILIFERKLFVPYVISTLLIALGYLPWLLSLFNNYHELHDYFQWQNYYARNQNIFTLILAQFYFAAYSFVAFSTRLVQANMFFSHVIRGNYFEIATISLVLALFVYSVFYSYKKGDRKTCTYISLIVLSQFFFFLLSDLIRDSGISLIWRYNILFTIGIMFFLVYLFNEKILSGRLLYSGFLLVLLLLGVISIVRFSDRYFFSLFQGQINNAALLSKSDHPLFISDMNALWPGADAGGVLAFMNECESDNIDVLRVTSDIKNIEDYYDSTAYSDIYVLQASNELIENLKSQLGEKMDSIDLDGFSNEWQIIY